MINYQNIFYKVYISELDFNIYLQVYIHYISIIYIFKDNHFVLKIKVLYINYLINKNYLSNSYKTLKNFTTSRSNKS